MLTSYFFCISGSSYTPDPSLASDFLADPWLDSNFFDSCAAIIENVSEGFNVFNSLFRRGGDY